MIFSFAQEVHEGQCQTSNIRSFLVKPPLALQLHTPSSTTSQQCISPDQNNSINSRHVVTDVQNSCRQLSLDWSHIQWSNVTAKIKKKILGRICEKLCFPDISGFCFNSKSKICLGECAILQTYKPLDGSEWHMESGAFMLKEKSLFLHSNHISSFWTIILNNSQWKQCSSLHWLLCH